MPQLLSLLVLAYAAGILAADRALVGRPGGLAFACAGLGVAALSRSAGLRVAGLLVAVAGTGAFALATRLDEASRVALPAPIEATFDARVLALHANGGRTSLDLERSEPAEGQEGRHRAAALPRRVRLIEDVPGTPILPGDRIRVAARLRAVEARHDPGVPDAHRRLARDGIGAVGRLLDPRLVVKIDEAEGPTPRQHLEALRDRLRERLLAAGEGGALAAALALGDRRGLTRADGDAFARLGLTHLLSVSGLHLVLASALFQTLAFALLRRSARLARRDARRPALLVALAGAAAYALLSGFDVPVQRSLAFVAAGAAGFLARRPIAASGLLSAAGGIVLAMDPAALFDVGAQLSFAASAALLLAAPLAGAAGARATSGRAAAVLRSVREGLSTSALATAATAPLLATQLGVTAPAGLVANLVAVPWTGLVLLPGALLAAASAGLPGGGLPDAVIDAVAAVSSATLWVLRAAADRAAGAAPPAPEPGVLALGAGALLAVLVLRARRLRVRLALALVAAILPALAPPPPRLPPPPRAVFLDVGQGDALLVQGRESTLLVDGGLALPDGLDLGRQVVLPALRALRVTRIDVVVATHADLDHRGGLEAVLDSLPVGELWLPYGGGLDPDFASLREAAAARGVAVREHGEGDESVALGDLVLAPLWPPAHRARAAAGAGRNDGSLVLRVEVSGRRLLLTGDASENVERALLAAGADLRSDVLKLGHHGSRTASSAAFLGATGARIAIASAPCQGRFGMPHPEVVERAAAARISLWWTGRDGAVSVGLGERLVALGEAPVGEACARRLAAPRPAGPQPAASVDEGGSALATRSTAGASAWHGHEPGRRDQRFAGAGRSGARTRSNRPSRSAAAPRSGARARSCGPRARGRARGPGIDDVLREDSCHLRALRPLRRDVHEGQDEPFDRVARGAIGDGSARSTRSRRPPAPPSRSLGGS